MIRQGVLGKHKMIPPAGVALDLSDLVRGVRLTCRGNVECERFARAICDYLKVSHALLVGSGRTALTVVLHELKEVSTSDEVLIPAYTCFSVPASIVRAGLKVKLCDIDLTTLDFEMAALGKMAAGRVLSVIPCNLFGLVSDVPEIQRIAKSHGAYIIDDAAQSFGAELNDAKSGTLGDVGIISFGRGKNITAYDGGAVITKSEDIACRLSRHPLFRGGRSLRWPRFKNMLGLLGYSVFIRPGLYWIPNGLPFLKLGESTFDPNFEMSVLSELQCSLAMQMLGKLDQLNEQRRNNAKYLLEHLDPGPSFIVPRPIEGSNPVYPRFPLLVLDRSLRERIYHGLRRRGIGVSKMYPTAIHRIPGIEPHLVNGGDSFPNAELLAASILTLPTHPMVGKDDLDVMIDMINRGGV